jgi:hypothetical protein
MRRALPGGRPPTPRRQPHNGPLGPRRSGRRTAKAARDQEVRLGDIIMSRSNDGTVDVRAARPGDRVDQVGNGNGGWPGSTTRRIVLRPNDSPIRRASCSRGDDLKDHVTLGYAATAHSARSDRRQLVCDPRRGGVAGHAVRGDDARTAHCRG